MSSSSRTSIRHHFLPTSRCRERRSDPTNKKVVSKKEHTAWHLLFVNLLPHEVVKAIRLEFQIPLFQLPASARRLLIAGIRLRVSQPESVVNLFARGLRLVDNGDKRARAWEILFGHKAEGLTAISTVVREWTPEDYQLTPPPKRRYRSEKTEGSIAFDNRGCLTQQASAGG